MGWPLRVLFTLCIAYFPVPAASYTHYENADSCTIIGDGDVYGIGIRTGLYIQSFAALLALIAGEPENIRTLRIGFNAIATALVINLFENLRHNGFIYLEFWIVSALLLFVLLPFTITSTTSVLLSKFRYPASEPELESAILLPSRVPTDIQLKKFTRPLTEEIGCFGVAWTFLLSAVLLGIQTWLYFRGLHLGHNPECVAKVNFYGNINMYNHNWIGVLKAVSILGAIAIPFILIMCMEYAFKGFQVSYRKTCAHEESDKSKPPISAPPPRARKPFLISLDHKFQKLRLQSLQVMTADTRLEDWALIVLALCLFPIISIIIWVEKIIRINNIDLSETPLFSSSQLIALLIAILTSLPILWTLCLTVLKEFNVRRGRDQNS